VTAELPPVQEFEVNEAITQIREDFGMGKIDAACMEREIDFALRGLRDQCQYLSPFPRPGPDQLEKVPR
jgi:hypothetical protein